MRTEVSMQAISDAFDPDRLRQGRTLARLKKNELAQKVGVSPAAIGQYESGVAKPRPEHLPDLAKALGVDVEFFASGRPFFRVDTGNVHFRSLRSMRAGDRDRALSTAEQVRELTHVLERYVEFPEVNLSEIAPGSTPAQAAQQVREHWHVPSGPIPHLIATMESYGIVVLVSKQGEMERVDAFSTDIAGRPIVVSTPRRSMEVYRHRFTCAHELGHLLLHPDPQPGDALQELEADQFAAALLTPANELTTVLPTRIDLTELDRISRTWGVSVESLLLRMREIRQTSETTLRRAYQRLAMLKDIRRPEPLTAYPGEMPVLLRQALELCEQEAGVGVVGIADELHWQPRRIRELLGVDDERPKLTVVR